MPSSITDTNYVYLKIQDGRSLSPKYQGPLLIVDRPTNSTVKLKVGTYADGRDRIEEHHWVNCRPAYVGPDTPIATRPKLGRPPARPSSPTPLPELSTDYQHPLSPFSDTTETQPIDEEEEVNKENPRKFKSASPSETSETPDITEISTPTISTGPPPSPPFQPPPTQNDRPRRHNMGIPHPKYADYKMFTAWSATQSQLDNINTSISGKGV